MSPKDNNKQVSAAVRILQQKRDASARATHLMVKNDPLITYEKAFGNQAAVKKFFIATFLERKIMSTKTSIKRIALVAAAALALGGFSAVSAKAAQTAAQTYVNCTTADGGTLTPSSTVGAECQGVAGEGNYVVLTTLSQAKDVKLNVSGAGATFSTPGTGFSALATPNTTAFWAASSAGTIRVLTPTVGTITVTVAASTAGSGIYSATTETVVITVVDKAAAGVYSATNSKVYLVAGETMTATADATTAPTAVATYTATDSSVASIVVKYLDGLSTGSAVLGDTLTATITSGPGYILVPRLASQPDQTGFASDTTTANYANANPGTGTFQASAAVGNVSGSAQVRAGGNFTALVFASGQTGTTVVTIKNKAGTIIGTKSIVFTGTTVATYTATVAKAFVDGDAVYTSATAGNANNAAIKLVATDSSGFAIPGAAAPTVTSTSTILSAGCGNDGIDTCTADSKGTFYFFASNTTAKTYGPATITFTTGTVKTTATLTFSSKLATTATISGPAEAAAGDPMSFTVTLKDAKGYAVPDGIAVSNYVASATTTAGVGTPVYTGKTAAGVATITASGATVAAETAKIVFTRAGTAATLDSYNTAADAATEVTVTVPLTSPADSTASLALDAANAATDAANNAYDEAQNATQAASDALAAVTALAAQVNSLIAMVKKLTAAVAKLKK